MSEPERIEPDPPSPNPGDGRADWLCGPDEGLEAELSRQERESHDLPAPKLIRPGAAGAAPVDPPRREGLRRPAPPPSELSRPELSHLEPGDAPPRRRIGAVQGDDSAASDFTTGPGAMMWTPPSNSVPTVRRERSERPERPRPQRAPAAPAREFPMDEPEEHARGRSAGLYASSSPPPHEVVSPEAFNFSAPPMPWWMQTTQLFLSDRRIQGLTALVVVLLLTIAFWPRGPRAISIGDLRRHPERFDGAEVTLDGRVGDVFSVGGGYAFYLVNGRDTMVVFTRSRTPKVRDQVTVAGVVSTGYLDGEPRQALFEEAKR